MSMKLKQEIPAPDFMASWGCKVSRLHIFTEPSLVAVMMELQCGTLIRDTTMDAKLPNLLTSFRFLEPTRVGSKRHPSFKALFSAYDWHAPAFQLPEKSCWGFTDSDGLAAIRKE